MAQGREIDVGLSGLHDLGEALVEHRIFLLRLVMHQLAVNREFCAPLGQHHLAGLRLGHDIPALLAGLAPVELGLEVETFGVGEDHRRGDRRVAVLGELQRRGRDEGRARQDVGDDGERIDARIEHAEAARLPNPLLVRVPVAHVFLPVHLHGAQRGTGDEAFRRFDGRRITRMPAGKQRQALGRSERLEIGDFRERRARRFFEEDMFARRQRLLGGLVAVLRRHAERDGIDGRNGRQHLVDRLEIVDAVDDAVAAGGGDQLVIAVLGDGRKMLIAHDLADADDCEIDRGHVSTLICMMI